MIRFDKNEMRAYFERFDYIDYKYNPLLKGVNEETDPTKEDIVLMFKKDFVRYERAKNHNLYEKIDYSQICDRLRLIYNDSEEAESIIFLYDFSLGQLVDRFINIPSLDKIFSHHYFEYEWEQHVDMNFEKNQQSFYRDHFVHQMRNCYMVMRYLDFSEAISEASYYEKILNMLKLRSNSVSQYACAQVDQYADFIRDKIQSDKTRYSRKNLESIDGTIMGIVDLMNQNVEDFAWSYLIRGSLIVAALFHDIGYPIRYTYKGTEAVSDYISLVRPSDNVGFDRLNDLLENSLLFRTVNKDELRERYVTLDHGALSAYILLMQFYESGAIRELDPIKKAIIELAAVIIYDHTLKYKFLGDKTNDRYVIRGKPSFKENPLSYTLRFVDDIQEWDRLYFEIEGRSEYLFCDRCKMPIVGTWDRFTMTKELAQRQSFVNAETDTIEPNDLRNYRAEIEGEIAKAVAGGGDTAASFEDDFSLEYITSPTKRTIYVCGCTDCQNSEGGKKGNPHVEPYHIGLMNLRKAVNDRLDSHRFPSGHIERGALFQYQTINYTITCDDVLLIRNWGKDTFYIDYNPYKELYLLLLNHKALRYRMKEFSKLGRQFRLQSDISIDVRTHITENPMMLKTRILCDFLYEAGAYVATNVSFGHNPYKRNLLYYDMLRECMCFSSTGTTYEILHRFVSGLKEKNFFAYGYCDDDICIEGTENDNAKGIEYAETDKCLCGILREAVLFLTGVTESDDDGRWSTFKKNLFNTLRCYLRLLIDYVVVNLAESHADKTPKSKLAEWMGGKPNFPELEKEYFKPEYIDDNHERACRIVFRDFMSQLYYQSAKGAGMEKYYELREKKPYGEKSDLEMKNERNSKDFVVGADEMEYALDVLFDEKYYVPMIMKEKDGINKGKDGIYRFNFFDIHSDMYLFKGMSDFVEDNRNRRRR